jgi:putative CocE/NonD family hydrolase
MNDNFTLANIVKTKVFSSTSLVLLLATALILQLPFKVNAQEGMVSQLGRYEGYSEPIYSEWVRTSQYVTVWDGTKLAVDIIRPAENGVPVEEPLPVIWIHHRYQRALVTPNGNIRTEVWYDSRLKTVMQHGYAIGVVDVRGGGASYGTRNGPFSPDEAQDAYDITEWFATQPWCNGRVSMYGRSYLGITQYFAASTIPPHLVAIFPEMAMFDFYSFVYPGGVFREDFATQWGSGVRRRDTNPINPTAPVDEDIDGAMRSEALTEHQGNSDVYTWTSGPEYRDSLGENDEMIHIERSPATYLEEVKKSGIAAYHLVGWYDMYPRDALLWYSNLEPNNPQKLVIGPWNHSASEKLMTTEYLRWYDFWLKDIDNGIMDEPPIHYYTMGAPPGQAWRSTWQWPLPEQEPTYYYFHSGPSGSVKSSNDGLLSVWIPTNPTDQDDVTVDYSATTGRATRWTNGYGGDFGYPDMTTNDEKGLTYTTPPLISDIELTGHPVIHLWVTSTAADGDFFAYLEEIEPISAGSTELKSRYITEGTLRASHRAISTPPFDYLNLPYHRSFAGDISGLPTGEPVELIFDMHPTSNIFDKGHRIRVTITFSDRDNTKTPELSPAPTVSVYRNANYASYIVLPVIPPPTSAFGPSPEDGSTINNTWALLRWESGRFASSHDVYFGDSFEDVNEGAEETYRGNQTDTWFPVGLTGNHYPEGLVRGTTYYWRIDEINDENPNSPWKGTVWSFTVSP